MLRRKNRALLVLSVFSVCAVVTTLVQAGEAAEEPAAPIGRDSFSVRPRIGALWTARGGIQDGYLDDDNEQIFPNFLAGELGLKGIFHEYNFGLELSIGGMGSDDEETTSLPEPGALEHELTFLSLKLTGTYETNPCAGLAGFEHEGNVYVGGGFGFYPMTDELTFDPRASGQPSRDAGDVDGMGYGFQLVVGAEYFFTRHLGLYAELQYSYIDIDREGMGNTNLMGFSTFGGLSLKF